MIKEAALYIQADPFTFNHLELVKKCINSFGYIHIFLDRKNKDSEYGLYNLSYQDRADIIKHDLKANKIDQYDIVPIDSTMQRAVKENNISTVVLNFNYQYQTNFRLFRILTEVTSNVQIMMLKANNFIEESFIKTLVDSDETMEIYKKYCSDYAYCRLKLKSMFKIALTGNSDEYLDKTQKIFENRNYRVIDVDKYLQTLPNEILENEKTMYQSVHKYIAEQIVGYFFDRIVIRGKLFFEYAMEKYFNYIVCAKTQELKFKDDEIICIEDKAKMSDFAIDFDLEQNASNQIVKACELIEKKIKINCY